MVNNGGLSTRPLLASDRLVTHRPRGSIVLHGGNLSVESKIRAIARSLNIPLEELQASDMMSDAHLQALREECQKQKIFDIYEELRQRCCFEGKTVVCVTIASSTAAQDAEYYKLLFRLLGAAKVLTIANEQDASAPGIIDDIKYGDNPLGWFGGGDQKRFGDAHFIGSPAHQAMYERYLNRSDYTVGGTSAGAGAMSRKVPWKSEIIQGLGFLQDIVVDMHVRRGVFNDPPLKHKSRVPRLQSAVEVATKNDGDKSKLGLGFDENTWAFIRGGNLEAGGR